MLQAFPYHVHHLHSCFYIKSNNISLLLFNTACSCQTSKGLCMSDEYIYVDIQCKCCTAGVEGEASTGCTEDSGWLQSGCTAHSCCEASAHSPWALQQTRRCSATNSQRLHVYDLFDNRAHRKPGFQIVWWSCNQMMPLRHVDWSKVSTVAQAAWRGYMARHGGKGKAKAKGKVAKKPSKKKK